MEEFVSWVLKPLFGAALIYSAGSGVNYFRKTWQIRKDKLNAKLEGSLEKLEAELEKLRSENFNFKVVRAAKEKFKKRIKKKLRKRG
jgi:hypothetical protein